MPLFHTVVSWKIKHMRVKHRPPAELIWETMRCKGWAVIDLADHMDGDRQRNRALLSLLFRDRSGQTRIGTVLCHRIAVALGLSPTHLENLERDWFAYRRSEPTRSAKGWGAPTFTTGDTRRRHRDPARR